MANAVEDEVNELVENMAKVVDVLHTQLGVAMQTQQQVEKSLGEILQLGKAVKRLTMECHAESVSSYDFNKKLVETRNCNKEVGANVKLLMEADKKIAELIKTIEAKYGFKYQKSESA